MTETPEVPTEQLLEQIATLQGVVRALELERDFFREDRNAVAVQLARATGRAHLVGGPVDPQRLVTLQSTSRGVRIMEGAQCLAEVPDFAAARQYANENSLFICHL